MNSHQSSFAYRSMPPMHHDQLHLPAARPRKKLQRRPCTSYDSTSNINNARSHNNYRRTVTAKLTDEKLLERRTFSTMALLDSLAGNRCDDIAEKHQQYQVDQQAHQRRRRPYKYHGGFRPDYKLGDALRSPQHLITEPSYKRFLSSTQALQNQEFAFIKRSNGSYSYAILAHRSMEPPKNQSLASTANNISTAGANSEVMLEECMTFVMNESGSTKMIRKHMWGEHVRLVAEYPQEEEQDKLEEKKEMENFLQCFDSKQSSPSQSIVPSCQEIVIPKSQEPPQVVYQQVIQRDARKEGVYDNAAPPNVISCNRLTYEEDDDCSSISSASEYARYYEKYFC